MEGGAYYVSFFLYLCARNKMDMNIENKLLTAVVHGIKALYGQEVPPSQVQLQKTKKEFTAFLATESNKLLRLFSAHI